jgi:hypothetical protein
MRAMFNTVHADVLLPCLNRCWRVLMFAPLFELAAEAMLVWGWRVPFLLAITTLVAATLLRMNMPGE